MIIHPVIDWPTGVTYGRRMHREVRVEMLKEWIEESPRRLASLTSVKPQYKELCDQPPQIFTLVDVRKQCLIPGPPDAECAALSYVWGKLERSLLRNLVANRVKLEESDALTPHDSLLPKTIRDSIMLVKALGIQYLWVDSLCVVQDDYGNKPEQLKAVGPIYSLAKFIIVAAAGDNSDTGLPGVGLSPRSVGQHIEIVRGYKLANKLSIGSVAMDSAYWKTRAWTYQDRIFSQALVVFTPHQAYYRCGPFEFSEDLWPDYQRNAS